MNEYNNFSYCLAFVIIIISDNVNVAFVNRIYTDKDMKPLAQHKQ